MKTFYAKDRKTWRKWLEKNHDKEIEIGLVYFRKATGKPTVTYPEAVEEALCFGWIDGIERKVDEERFMGRFTPRRPISNWSPTNRVRAKRLIEQGLMAGAGLKALPKDL